MDKMIADSGRMSPGSSDQENRIPPENQDGHLLAHQIHPAQDILIPDDAPGDIPDIGQEYTIFGVDKRDWEK